ncbi:protein of unknown function [Ralstonia solanacearum CMR15]|nr:protein of unknown function [Ralstonia solanacearum CMR15]
MERRKSDLKAVQTMRAKTENGVADKQTRRADQVSFTMMAGGRTCSAHTGVLQLVTGDTRWFRPRGMRITPGEDGAHTSTGLRPNSKLPRPAEDDLSHRPLPLRTLS